MLSTAQDSLTAKAQDSSSSIAVMEGVDPQRTRAYQTKSLRQMHGVAWKTPRMFELDYRQVIMLGNDSMTFTDIGFSDPMLSNGVIYIRLTVSHSQHYIFAIQTDRGNVLWTFKLKQAMSTPAVVGRSVYFTANDGYFYALDAQTGVVTWQHKSKGINWNTYAAPIIVNGLAYCMGLNGIIYELDLTSKQGRIVYSAKEPLVAPAYNDDTIFTGDDKFVYAIDTKSGLQKWKFRIKGTVGPPIVALRTVMFRTLEGRMYCLDVETGEQKWSAKIGEQGEIITPFNFLQRGTRLAYSDGKVFFEDSDQGKQTVFAVDSRTGQKVWTLRIDDLSRPPVVAGGMLYLGGLGALYAVDAKTGHLEWRLDFIGNDDGRKAKHVVSSPAVHDGAIYFVSDEGSFYCVN